VIQIGDLVPFPVDRLAVALACADKGMHPAVVAGMLVILAVARSDEPLPFLVDTPDRSARPWAVPLSSALPR
jgi:hypothetical protein